MEIWKPIRLKRDSVEYKNYEISSIGRVRNKKTNKILTPKKINNLYYYNMQYKGVQFTENAQKLMVREFLGLTSVGRIFLKDKSKCPLDLNNLLIEHNGVRIG